MQTNSRFIAALIIGFSTAIGLADDSNEWSRFRGPLGNGIATKVKLPWKWDSSRNVAWKTEIPGPGASSPVVHRDRIFLTCFTGYLVPGEPAGSLEQLQRHLLALRLSDGKIV